MSFLVARSYLTLCDLLWQHPLSFTISPLLLKFMSFELVMPSNRLILYHPLPLLHSIFASIIPLIVCVCYVASVVSNSL